MPWVRDVQSGGNKVPERLKEPTRRRILAHAERTFAGRYLRLDVRFKGVYCYIDAYRRADTRGSPWKITGETREEYIKSTESTPIHLVRLRFFTEDHWSVAFFAYSSERYEPCFFPSGKDMGTPEEGLEVGQVYLS